jgi:hypothetical protein
MTDSAIVDIVASINKLSADQRNEIIAKLSAAAAPPGKLMTFAQSMVASAGNAQRLVELKQIKATCNRHAIELPDNERIDTAKLDKQLSAQNVDRETRMTLKGLLFRVGMIGA